MIYGAPATSYTHAVISGSWMWITACQYLLARLVTLEVDRSLWRDPNFVGHPTWLGVTNWKKITMWHQLETFPQRFFKGYINDKANVLKVIFRGSRGSNGESVGLVTRGCGFESRLWQELSTTEVRPLSKAPNPRLLPLLQVCVCVRTWMD